MLGDGNLQAKRAGEEKKEEVVDLVVEAVIIY
jgi:hypothetical protein